ncbi:hypothetical protein [Dyella amyloliquefaciens]|nr:hypothetical protein [Dyella amyloliquefaciens]
MPNALARATHTKEMTVLYTALRLLTVSFVLLALVIGTAINDQ